MTDVFILFAVIGMVEVGPNVCKIDYMRYVDVASITVPCNIVKLNTMSDLKVDVIH